MLRGERSGKPDQVFAARKGSKVVSQRVERIEGVVHAEVGFQDSRAVPQTRADSRPRWMADGLPLIVGDATDEDGLRDSRPPVVGVRLVRLAGARGINLRSTTSRSAEGSEVKPCKRMRRFARPRTAMRVFGLAWRTYCSSCRRMKLSSFNGVLSASMRRILSVSPGAMGRVVGKRAGRQRREGGRRQRRVLGRMLFHARDVLRDAAFGDAKILRFQPANGVAILVLHNDVQHDRSWARAKSRREARRLRELTKQTARRLRSRASRKPAQGRNVCT